jgi:hypothetical protein
MKKQDKKARQAIFRKFSGLGLDFTFTKIQQNSDVPFDLSSTTVYYTSCSLPFENILKVTKGLVKTKGTSRVIPFYFDLPNDILPNYSQNIIANNYLELFCA